VDPTSGLEYMLGITDLLSIICEFLTTSEICKLYSTSQTTYKHIADDTVLWQSLAHKLDQNLDQKALHPRHLVLNSEQALKFFFYGSIYIKSANGSERYPNGDEHGRGLCDEWGCFKLKAKLCGKGLSLSFCDGFADCPGFRCGASGDIVHFVVSSIPKVDAVEHVLEDYECEFIEVQSSLRVKDLLRATFVFSSTGGQNEMIEVVDDNETMRTIVLDNMHAPIAATPHYVPSATQLLRDLSEFQRVATSCPPSVVFRGWHHDPTCSYLVEEIHFDVDFDLPTDTTHYVPSATVA